MPLQSECSNYSMIAVTITDRMQGEFPRYISVFEIGADLVGRPAPCLQYAIEAQR